MMKWFRVYSEIKDDPKMLEMDDHQRWLWLCRHRHAQAL